MNKTFCDKCGKELPSKTVISPRKMNLNTIELNGSIFTNNSYDICENCYNLIVDFMKI